MLARRDRAAARGCLAVLRRSVVAVVVLSLAPPFSLTDTFNYLHYGRMQPLYGLDPYTALPIQASADPAYALLDLASPAEPVRAAVHARHRGAGGASRCRSPTGC